MQPFTLQVLTYNIHKGFSIGNARFVLHHIREALETEDVDLIFLQEIQGEHVRRQNYVKNWPDTPQFEFLADRLWPHYAYGKNAIYSAGHHGNAILSKHPFVSWENINVASHTRASRSLLHGVIEPPGRGVQIHVICIHLGLSAAERQRQIGILSSRISSHVPKQAPLIIAGDFNDWLGRAARHMEGDLGLRDVFRELEGRYARTFPIWWPVLPVDRIYYRGASAQSARCLQEMPWRRLSDHAPLYASFRFDGMRSAPQRHEDG